MALLAAWPAAALELSIPNGTIVRTETDPLGRVRLPEAPWSPDVAPVIAEGNVQRQIVRVPSASLTPLQLIDGLRTALEDEGYQEVFGCANAACGGFDFRFQLDILGEPDMHVDLGNFIYLLMRSPDPDARPQSVALVASRTQTNGFIHITTVSPPSEVPEPERTPDSAETTAPEPQAVPDAPDDLIASLTDQGHAVLEDLDFGTGSSELGAGPYGSLEALAVWLTRNTSARIVLVGHTDSVGSLEANTALSQRRATSVSEALRIRYGVDPAQLQAAGAGFLAPRASNLTEEGRALNRRVEVVLLSVE